MPLLLRRMGEEEKIKMKSQVVACAAAFVTNLTGRAGEEDDISEEVKDEGKQLLSQYSQQLVEAISVLLQLSID